MKAKSQDLLREHWDDVRIFLAVYRAGSLGKAAARLGVDTSTVSRRLAALETSLDARLFERGREGLVPTPTAEAVAPAADAMETALARFARGATAGSDAVPEGVVRISTAPGLAEAFIAPALIRLRARAPGIRVELDAAIQVRDLAKHEVDLALRSVKPEGAQLVVTRLVRTTWVAVAAPALAAELGPVQRWDALPWIAWDHDLAEFGPARWLVKHAARAEVVLRTSHFASQSTACATGLGVMLLPEPYMRVMPLVPLQLGPEVAGSAAKFPVDDLWLVAHRDTRDLPRIAVTWQFLVDELRIGKS